MLLVLAFATFVSIFVGAQEIGLSGIFNGEESRQSSSPDLEESATGILRSIKLGDLVKELEETNAGIRESVAEILNEQMHNGQQAVPQAKQTSIDLPAMSPARRAISIKARGGCANGSISTKVPDVTVNNSRKLKRLTAAQLLKAASELLSSSSPSQSHMRGHRK
ncbi:hypothetical protein Tcan_13495 [Toxocara canis]|uniref:Uncharacterized protein n=2 Tax=Toxocara canis TaxID=6265 RepID=A0A0B2VPI3_TOXCA|nr:hypothetical protein Tcan_13495 [Toxocara canis]VDM39496.1 unnamed protein product [Toxocara canis]